jgi:DNA repair protein RadA/Sms
VPLAEVDGRAARPVPTGVAELDRVLAGGLVPGSATLIYGEPGVGKSTLLLQVLSAVAGQGASALLVSAEESAAQVRARTARTGEPPAALLVCDTADLSVAQSAWRSCAPSLVVVDSVQTLADPEVAGPAGSISQVRSCADRLVRLAKTSGVPLILVGQVTKEGDVAGPRALEHLVDTVLVVEGDRHHALRLLRAVKHRFGPTGEVGLFTMGEDGLVGLDDPGALLLGDRNASVPGSAVTALLQGRRPLVVELQALVCPAPAGLAAGARRSVQGLDSGRLALVLAVLEARLGLTLGALQVFVSAAGGVRATEPAMDLPLALALTSAAEAVALPERLVSFGEVGLAGELRHVPGADRRLAEAARMGFTTALVPASTVEPPRGMRAVRAATLAEAVQAVRRLARPPIRSVRPGAGRPAGPVVAPAATGRW